MQKLVHFTHSEDDLVVYFCDVNGQVCQDIDGFGGFHGGMMRIKGIEKEECY